MTETSPAKPAEEYHPDAPRSRAQSDLGGAMTTLYVEGGFNGSEPTADPAVPVAETGAEVIDIKTKQPRATRRSRTSRPRIAPYVRPSDLEPLTEEQRDYNRAQIAKIMLDNFGQTDSPEPKDSDPTSPHIRPYQKQ